MSQPSSPHSPRRPVKRQLLTPEERFGVPGPPISNPQPEISDSFVPEKSSNSARLDDEMARRHLPPHLRRKHERTLRKREKREARRRIGVENARHEQRSQAERAFALEARQEAPQPRPKRRRRVPVVLKRLLWLVCFLFCVQLGFAAFSAPQFAIQSVAIVGASTTPTEQLRPLALKLIGQNFLRANRSAVEKAVAELPTIATARVQRLAQWPPRVELQITERQPVLKVGAGNNWWVVDENGVPFRRSNAEDGGLYTVVAPQFSPALRQKLPASLWQRALELNAAIRADNQRVATEKSASDHDAAAQNAADEGFWRLRRIYFDKEGLASLRLTGQGALVKHNEMLVRLGDDQWTEKLARARVALSYFERTGRRAQELDLVSLERPVWFSGAAQITVQTSAKGVGRVEG